ncbi:inositol polyphosphate 5-phosphatase [Balamuthia mandrillaris]
MSTTPTPKKSSNKKLGFKLNATKKGVAQKIGRTKLQDDVVKEYMKRLKETRTFIMEVHSSITKYNRSTAKNMACARDLANTFLSWGERFMNDNEEELGDCLSRAAQLLLNLEDVRANLHAQLEKLGSSTDVFLANDYEVAKEQKKKYDKTRANYDAAVQKVKSINAKKGQVNLERLGTAERERDRLKEILMEEQVQTGVHLQETLIKGSMDSIGQLVFFLHHANIYYEQAWGVMTEFQPEFQYIKQAVQRNGYLTSQSKSLPPTPRVASPSVVLQPPSYRRSSELKKVPVAGGGEARVSFNNEEERASFGSTSDSTSVLPLGIPLSSSPLSSTSPPIDEHHQHRQQQHFDDASSSDVVAIRHPHPHYPHQYQLETVATNADGGVFSFSPDSSGDDIRTISSPRSDYLTHPQVVLGDAAAEAELTTSSLLAAQPLQTAEERDEPADDEIAATDKDARSKIASSSSLDDMQFSLSMSPLAPTTKATVMKRGDMAKTEDQDVDQSELEAASPSELILPSSPRISSVPVVGANSSDDETPMTEAKPQIPSTLENNLSSSSLRAYQETATSITSSSSPSPSASPSSSVVSSPQPPRVRKHKPPTTPLPPLPTATLSSSPFTSASSSASTSPYPSPLSGNSTRSPVSPLVSSQRNKLQHSPSSSPSSSSELTEDINEHPSYSPPLRHSGGGENLDDDDLLLMDDGNSNATTSSPRPSALTSASLMQNTSTRFASKLSSPAASTFAPSSLSSTTNSSYLSSSSSSSSSPLNDINTSTTNNDDDEMMDAQQQLLLTAANKISPRALQSEGEDRGERKEVGKTGPMWIKTKERVSPVFSPSFYDPPSPNSGTGSNCSSAADLQKRRSNSIIFKRSVISAPSDFSLSDFSAESSKTATNNNSGDESETANNNVSEHLSSSSSVSPTTKPNVRPRRTLSSCSLNSFSAKSDWSVAKMDSRAGGAAGLGVGRHSPPPSRRSGGGGPLPQATSFGPSSSSSSASSSLSATSEWNRALPSPFSARRASLAASYSSSTYSSSFLQQQSASSEEDSSSRFDARSGDEEEEEPDSASTATRPHSSYQQHQRSDPPSLAEYKPNYVVAPNYTFEVIKVRKRKRRSVKATLSIDCTNKTITLKEEHKTAKERPIADLLQVTRAADRTKLRFLWHLRENPEKYVFQSCRESERFYQAIWAVKYPPVFDKYGTLMRNETLNVFIGNWNLGDAPPPSSLSAWIPREKFDIYAIAVEECKYPPRLGHSSCEADWFNCIQSHLGPNYIKMAGLSLLSIRLIIMVKREHYYKIANIEKEKEATGIANVVGNKGGIGVSFSFFETSLCFVGCHLAAHHEMIDARNKDFHHLMRGLRLGRYPGDLHTQFDHLFFVGDLNYRINLDREDVMRLIEDKDWQKLYEKDQLKEQRELGKVFNGFQEGDIVFPPTYRYTRGDRTYNPEKGRIPSYTDRILWRSLPNRVTSLRYYTSNDDLTTRFTSSPSCFSYLPFFFISLSKKN